MTLTDLRDLLDAATGPSRELDDTIWETLFPGDSRYEPDNFWWYSNIGELSLTASIDAALALVERMLPGWSIAVLHHVNGAPCKAEVWVPNGDGVHWHGHAPTAPLAILRALVAALIAKDTDHD